MAASSGFRGSPGHTASVDVLGIAPADRNGNKTVGRKGTFDSHRRFCHRHKLSYLT
jgi:hypothetical protein